MPVAFFCRIIQVDVAAFYCPVICNAHESCCAVVLAVCALHFVVLFLPGSVSVCSQPSRVVLVARFQLKRVRALIVVPGFSRGRNLPQSRNFLLDVVHNAWFAYFQWPVAKSSARAAVCSCSSASLATFGDFGDFGVSDVATVAGRYTRRGGPRLSVLSAQP